MKRIGETLAAKGLTFREREQEVLQAVLAHPEVAAFIQHHQLDQTTIERSLSKFNEYRLEKEKFITQDPTYGLKGYEPILVMNEGYADVSYRETEALLISQQQEAVAKRIQLINLPKSYRRISFSDIDFDDPNRLPLLKELNHFLVNYPHASKGLYLYGNMGLGKSFLMAGLARELSEKKQVAVTMIHYPTFVVDVKNAISSGTVKAEIDAVKTAPVLILDDIGAEQSTSWVRDEVLQVILQYRMLEELPTFFTSNYSLDDLEKKFAQGKTGDETWQAKRVLERIRAVSKELHLLGKNRR